MTVKIQISTINDDYLFDTELEDHEWRDLSGYYKNQFYNEAASHIDLEFEAHYDDGRVEKRD